MAGGRPPRGELGRVNGTAEGGTTGRGGSRARDGAARWFRTGRSETVLALGTSLHSEPVTHVTHVPPGPEFCLPFFSHTHYLFHSCETGHRSRT